MIVSLREKWYNIYRLLITKYGKLLCRFSFTKKPACILVMNRSSFYNRRGSLRAAIDLRAGRISWTDTHMWNNDFVRALSPKVLEHIRKDLPETELLSWATDYAKGIGHLMGSMTASFPQDWSVEIRFSDGEVLKACGVSSFPKAWNRYRQLIEEVAKTSFRLR